jgi:hypothetical protein
VTNTGEVEMSLPRATSEAWNLNPDGFKKILWVYDVEVIDSGGLKDKWMYGEVSILPEVTR